MLTTDTDTDTDTDFCPSDTAPDAEPGTNNHFLSEGYLTEQIGLIDEKVAEIEAAVERLSAEEAEILAQRADRVSGDVEAIVSRTRREQMRLQELRDTLEVEQAPLAELKARRAEMTRQYQTLKRLKTRERLKQLLSLVDVMQKQLSSIKDTLETLDDPTSDL